MTHGQVRTGQPADVAIGLSETADLHVIIPTGWRRYKGGGLIVFRGRAVLKDPESGATVGAFTETCKHNGITKAKVVLREPITLEGTQTLEVFGTVKDQAAISMTTKNGAATKIHEFGGTSALGCLPDKMDVAFVRSPGGELGTLLAVLGKGTIHPDHG